MADRPVEVPDPAVLVRAAIETLVFAPIGFGAKLVDDTPAAVRRMRQELRNARFIGRLTVEQGTARMREHVEALDVVDEDVENPVPDSAGSAATLPIDGYDEMPAIEIVGRLEALSSAERALIADHESAHRRRRTVLGKIAQLAE